MNEVGSFIVGALIGLFAGFGIAWWLIHTICDHFLQAERERTTEERHRAELYKRIVEDLKAQIEFPEFINER